VQIGQLESNVLEVPGELAYGPGNLVVLGHGNLLLAFCSGTDSSVPTIRPGDGRGRQFTKNPDPVHRRAL
jgi:hypothetical protein